MESHPSSTSCPCDSGSAYAACCKTYCEGDLPAPSAEALMRSRYTAFAMKNIAYLKKTWHQDTRPAEFDLDDQEVITWSGLEILATEQGRQGDQQGTVEFVAHFRANGQRHQLHEKSRFVHQAGQWYYLDGEVQKPQPLRQQKTGRNTPCPCGSGKKFKRCCLRSERSG